MPVLQPNLPRDEPDSNFDTKSNRLTMLLPPVFIAILFWILWSTDASQSSNATNTNQGAARPVQATVSKQTDSAKRYSQDLSARGAQTSGLINLRIHVGPEKSEEKTSGFWDSKFWSGPFPSVVTALVSLVTLFLTMLFNDRKDKRLYETNAQAERRLQTETLIKWVQLHSNGKDIAPIEQRAAALLVLAKSGFAEMAITQLDSLWKREPLDAGTAVAIIDEGFRSTSTEGNQDARTIHDLAAMTLEFHAEKLVVGKPGSAEFYWPNQVEWRWRPDLSLYARLAVWQALVTNLLTHRFKDWHAGTIRGAVVTLHAAMTTDHSSVVKHASAKLINAVLQQLKSESVKTLLASDQEYHSIDSLLKVSQESMEAKHETLPTNVEELLGHAVEWCRGEYPKPKLPTKTM